MSNINKSRIFVKKKSLNFNRICRTCLTERGYLREISTTRLPIMIEKCIGIRVDKNDNLPNKVCATCFRQITRFYTFKRLAERNDKLLHNHLRKRKAVYEYSDILHKAVNDAEIDSDTVTAYESDSEDNMPLIERYSKWKIEERIKLGRKSKENAKHFIDVIMKDESFSYVDEVVNDSLILKDKKPSFDNCVSNLPANTLETLIFNDGPPPLVPLETSKMTTRDNVPLSIKNLPENAPPLIPIKPLIELKSSTILTVFNENVENPINLQLQCNSCKEEFNSISALKNHKLNQCTRSNMQCIVCKKEFSDRMRLISHLKGHMISKDYICKICEKCYPNPSTLRVHMRTHTGEKPFKCQVCSKAFIRWAGVVGHMKTHESAKPYKCNTCGKSFKISSNLERHKILHSGILPYSCSYCGKTFSQSDNLQLHVRTYHTNERPYLCSECGKRFVSITRLKRHTWVHTGYKPYMCRFCSKAYANSNDRKTHEKSHTGGLKDDDKRYACNKCSMRFIHKCRLMKHKQTHERPFACKQCTKTFSSEVLLTKHTNAEHLKSVENKMKSDEFSKV